MFVASEPDLCFLRPRERTIKLNVGGVLYTATARILMDAPYFAKTMQGHYGKTFNSGSPSEMVRVDRDGLLFAHILDYLRLGTIPTDLLLDKDMYRYEPGFIIEDDCYDLNRFKT